MALDDGLRSFITSRGETTTRIAEPHDVVIVGETHAFLMHEENSAIRTRASVRLVLELLGYGRYRYFANEGFLNAGPVRVGIRDYWRDGTLPPPFDPAATGLSQEEIARRVLTRRYKPILDFLRTNPRYILSIGSRIDGPARHRRLAQHFFEEMGDRRINMRTPGVMLLGALHAAAAPFEDGEKTTRMILEERGYRCVSILVLTDFAPDDTDPDDLFFPLPIADVPAAATSVVRLNSGFVRTVDDLVGVRLTAVASTTPVTIPTDRQSVVNQPSPFRLIRSRWSSRNTVADQYEYIVLQKA
ncbi:MAG: hypothetical protein JO008_07355 [Alphaproteobacteria bacterium]|nr:hypothetical protein [Alphaproteobacteria bacterium]